MERVYLRRNPQKNFPAENLPALESGAKEDTAPEMIHTQYPGDINQALIELGSTVCRVQDPRCGTCPIRSWCCAYKLTNDHTDENGIVSARLNNIPCRNTFGSRLTAYLTWRIYALYAFLSLVVKMWKMLL